MAHTPAASAAFPLRIDLSEGRQVAKGSIRLVYEHPAFPGALVKVFRPNRLTPGGDLVYKTYRRFTLKLRRRLGAHTLTMRELAEHLAFHARHAASWRERPFAATIGVVDTDLGLGLVVERVADASGALAPTLASLLKQGLFTEAHRAALVRFLQALERWHVCVGDMNAGNIVLVETPEGEPRFLAVDGLGLRSAIPLQDWFKPLNAIQVRKRTARLWAAVEAGLAKKPAVSAGFPAVPKALPQTA